MLSYKEQRRRRIRYRIRNKIKGNASRPRLSIYRSNKSIYCQLIDDSSGTTLAQANSSETASNGGSTKTDVAKSVGKLIAERSKKLDIEHVIFDRGGYLYHGRVKSLADGAREGGLIF